MNATDVAILFEWDDADELAAAEMTLNAGANAAREYDSLCKKAEKRNKGDGEWQEAACRAADERRLVDRRWPAERDAAGKASKAAYGMTSSSTQDPCRCQFSAS